MQTLPTPAPDLQFVSPSYKKKKDLALESTVHTGPGDKAVGGSTGHVWRRSSPSSIGTVSASYTPDHIFPLLPTTLSTTYRLLLHPKNML